ncbi:Mth938-like domain-containing protein [candidate division WOR-3 bacterium]|nr:Mth938-like domain-containing protein [candidate division WOR-3 bacterium]
MIDSYSFGRIIIDGIPYTSDIILYPASQRGKPDRVNSNWWRKSGHQLQLNDLDKVIKEAPETLVIGTGTYELMKVPDEVMKNLNSKGIEVIVERTKEACKTYNKLKLKKKTIAALHLTC